MAIHYHVLLSKCGLEVNLGNMWVEDNNFFWSLCSNLSAPGAGCRFKRLTGRHDVQIYESDYKYFAARVKHRRAPQHSLSSMPVLSVSYLLDHSLFVHLISIWQKSWRSVIWPGEARCIYGGLNVDFFSPSQVGNLQISPHLLYINRFVLASCLVIIGIQHVFLAL